jgi:hypothetical protein
LKLTDEPGRRLRASRKFRKCRGNLDLGYFVLVSPTLETLTPVPFAELMSDVSCAASELSLAERADLHIDADTTVPRWYGERLDYGLAVEMLLQLAPATDGVPAGT